jgi:hypothetical protein
MDLIAIASQTDWTLTQLAPHQNSSVENTFAGGIDGYHRTGRN